MTSYCLMNSIISWNIRGLNSPAKQEDVRVFLRQQKIGMIAFLETKVQHKNIQQVAAKICPKWEHVHNTEENERGRILILWQPRYYQFRPLFHSDQMVHGEAIQLSTKKRFLISFIYGSNLEEERAPLWADIIRIAQNTASYGVS